MSSIIVPRDTTSLRPTGVNGMIRYNTTSQKFEVYEGLWQNMISSGGGAGDNLGNHTATVPLIGVVGTAGGPGYTFSGDTDTGFFRASANMISATTGGTERMRIDNLGNVAIGSTVPSARVDVSGQLLVRAYNAGTSTSIDWNLGNNQYTAPSGGACTAITLTNMLDGGSYTLAVQGVTSGTCSFTHSGLTFVYSPSNAAVTADAVYTFLRMGSKVYVSWVTGFAP